MKKKMILLMTSIMILGSILTGCGNKDMWDTVYEYDYAIIELPNGEIVEGTVESWSDYEGEQLQITIDGNIYLTNSFNCTLIKYDTDK